MDRKIEKLIEWSNVNLESKDTILIKLESYINRMIDYETLRGKLESFAELSVAANSMDIEAKKYLGSIEKKIINLTVVYVKFSKWLSSIENLFEIHAFDYILKTFDEKRIAKTINHLKEKYINNNQNNMIDKISEIVDKLSKEDKNLKKIPCEENGIIKLIDVYTIYYCFIEDQKTYVKTSDKTYLTNYILYDIETKTNLFRVHRSYLVNIDKIKELYSWFNGTYKLVIDDFEKT